MPGQLDTAVAGWFGRFPGAMDSREDAYLVHPVLRGLAVKIRAGQMLEVKRYHGSLGILDAVGRARGRIECSRHRATAAIHPREGEESPARRRQDQSSSHYQWREGRTEMTRGRGTPWLTWSPSDIQT
jgi:hypothetical protein